MIFISRMSIFFSSLVIFRIGHHFSSHHDITLYKYRISCTPLLKSSGNSFCSMIFLTSHIIRIEVKASSSFIDLHFLYKCILRHHDRSIITASFDEHCLQYFSRYNYPLMYLTCNRWIQIPLLLVQNKIRYVDVLTTEYIMWLRNEFVQTEIFLFTLNDENVWKWINDSFPHMMIDGIITDRPSECFHYVVVLMMRNNKRYHLEQSERYYCMTDY